MNKTFYSLARYSLLLLMSLYSIESYALNNVLDRIEVQDSRDQSVVKLTFTERLVYRSHAPLNKADLINIDVNFQGNASSVTFENESLGWKATKNVPLFEVGLEWNNRIQAALILRLNKEVEFDVQPSSDSYSITITIYHPQGDQVVVSPLPVDDLLPLPEFQKSAENEILANLMEEARQVMAKEDYSKAISLYTKILGHDKSVFAKQALEYLGVAREKKKQLAHAKNIYEQYLKRYPDGEDADRVKQRLYAMISASDAPRDKLRVASKDEKEQASEWEFYGGFSQLYNRSTTVPDIADRSIIQDDLRSDLDFTTRLRAQNYDLEARFTGGHTANFLSDGQEDEKRISSLYFEAKDKVRGASVRVGRQSRTTGGVLGRYDGLFGDYQLNEKVKLNVVSGYPVDSSRDVQISTERVFYGISADIGTINNAWDFNAFVINQDNDDLTDRRSVGGEVRYFDPKKSFFSLVDYDVFYNDLNLFIFNGHISVTDKTTANMSYEFRNSPILTTRNALNGQTVTHLQELLNIFPEQTIYDLAQDRTAENNILFLGLTHQFNNQFQINGDIRLSKLSDTVSSGGVLANVGTDLEKEYSIQLTGTSLIKEGDLVLLTTTYSDLTTSDISTISINTRYPVNKKLRINPKLKVRYRDNEITGSTQTTYTPSFQLTYRVRRNFQLEAEVSGDWETIKLAGTTLEDKNYYFLVGYRYDF